MKFLNWLRMILFLAIMIVAILFAVKNPSQTVDVDLVFLQKVNVNLLEVLFYALILGMAGGFAVAVLKKVCAKYWADCGAMNRTMITRYEAIRLIDVFGQTTEEQRAVIAVVMQTSATISR